VTNISEGDSSRLPRWRLSFW